ncbi:hypothetical protein L2E82_25916 [Cichorium intybus]|uniref:Uncharacterized protein n=1 Tax=Cichorium intybus TaxID=13427 RepID=A0ACB9E5V2_CICIN|nr:hypothetical protein L2E82_25916 [Cichorium intybus]
MGGGVAMRAAAKAATMGVFNGGLRGGESVVSAARQANRSVASVVSSSDDVKLAIANNDGKANSSVEKPYDDWEFAGVEDELFMETREPMPRLVFGGAPTIQEAKQATSDLNDALEKTYLSSNATNGQLLSALSDSDDADTKTCLVSESSVSKHAIQAFKLLNESPAAQNVVASIACDPNVWTAVLKNEALVDFLESHQTSVLFPEFDLNGKGFTDENSKESESKAESGKGFMDYIDDIKQKITVTVVDMMNSLSDTFQTLFGGAQKGEISVNPDGTAGISMEKSAIGATLMGLAIMVITVVVLKRA